MSERQMISAFMQGLVDRAGGVDAAAALIGARLGTEISKGTISKRMTGKLGWPLDEIRALEKVLNDFPVSRWVAQSLPEAAEGLNIMQGAGAMAVETGEAMAAVMDFTSGRGSKDRARKEVQDAVAATAAMAALLEASE